VATALTAMFQQEGVWPKRLANEAKGGDGKLDAKAAYALVAGTTKYFSLSTSGTQLSGHDRFGILSPWAAKVVKKQGTAASLGSKVGGTKTVEDHILHFALDLDGDGKILGANVGGQSVDIRATAAVWCCGKDGEISPYPLEGGSGKKGSQSGANQRSDDIYSWTIGQTKEVQ